MFGSNDIYIDKIDMQFVQTLITAVNESKLSSEEKEDVRKTLDRWQHALMLVGQIRITF